MSKRTNFWVPTTAPLACLATAALMIVSGAGPVAAQTGRNGQIHIQKDCPPSINKGAPGDYCQVISSNLSEIPANAAIGGAGASKVLYDQAAGIPKGLLDSNVVLDAGQGNRAFGRCTLDFTTLSGLCTFSDGVGTLSGFTARVVVTYLKGQGDGYVFAWDGTYSYNPLPGR